MNFEKSGRENSMATLKQAFAAAGAAGVRYMIVASVKGTTISQALEMNAEYGLNLICVTHQIGFSGPGKDEMPAEMREKLAAAGVKVLTTTHLFGGVDRSLRRQFQGIYPAEIIANTLRMFGQGVKVAVEISAMALDAGLIPYGEDVIAIAGTARGADAALLLAPAHADSIFETRIREVICMAKSDK